MQSEIMPGNNINNIKYIYIFTCKLHRHRDRDRDRDRREAHTQKTHMANRTIGMS